MREGKNLMFDELKKRRTELGKSIDEVANLTKIKKSYIQALEEGNFEQLPLEVYTRAYIKTYSELLGLDSTKFIEKYESYLHSRKSASNMKDEFIRAKKEDLSYRDSPSKRNYPRWLVTAVISISVFLLVFLISFLDHRKNEIPPPPPITSTKVQSNESLHSTIEDKSQQKQADLFLKIEATDKVWMRIIIDDREKREFLLNSGQTVNLEARKSFKLHIGNAGGVKVYFNNQDVGSLGELGQVVYLKLPKD